jgi:glycosyltransferase involved in cell wall biosynthesis
MRILIEGHFIDYEIQLAKALSKREDVILVLPFGRLDEEFREMVNDQFDVRTLETNKLNFLPDFLRRLTKLVSVIRHTKPDIVHIQVQGGPLDFVTLLYFKIFEKCPVVTTFHDVKPHLGGYTKLMIFLRYWIRKYSNAIIVHGERLKELMIKEYNILPEKIHVIPIGEHEVAPFKKYERADIKDDGKTILFFGRIYEYKGLKYLIQAEPLISRQVPGIKIIIAGTGENFERYRDMIGERHQNFVVHNYRIPYNEGAEIFQKSSIVVLPYIEASQSGVVLTAYGFKKPVVVTDVGSIPEIVDNNITGYVIPPKNHEKLADAIIRLLVDENMRKKMGENGYTKLKTELSFNEIAKKTMIVYRAQMKIKK